MTLPPGRRRPRAPEARPSDPRCRGRAAATVVPWTRRPVCWSATPAPLVPRRGVGGRAQARDTAHRFRGSGPFSSPPPRETIELRLVAVMAPAARVKEERCRGALARGGAAAGGGAPGRPENPRVPAVPPPPPKTPGP